MALLRPRLGNMRVFVGSQQRETDSAGELVAGFTIYTDTGNGSEAYETNYVGLAARSDTIQGAVQSLQGNDVTTRRVGITDADMPYAGSLKENEGHAVNPDAKPGLKLAESAA